jgi:hypothetical protein
VWAKSVIENFTGKKLETLECHWLEHNIRDSLVYRVTTFSNNQHKHYLIKLFANKQALAALHEMELMQLAPDLPSLNLLATDNVQGLNCLLFEWQKGELILDGARKDLDNILIKFPIPSLFIEKYHRSHSVLPQRLDKGFWLRVQNISTLMGDNNCDNVKRLSDVSKKINSCLNKLPLVIVNQNKSSTTLLRLEAGDICELDWTRWSIEPMGSGMLTNNEQFNGVLELANQIRDYHLDINDNEIMSICLAALMYRFEALVKAQQFNKAYKLIPDILICLDKGRIF